LKTKDSTTNEMITYLLEFRKLYKRIFGKLGCVMSVNSYQLYLKYFALYSKDEEKASTIQGYIEEAADFSIKQ
jgi:hypothetical protein